MDTSRVCRRENSKQKGLSGLLAGSWKTWRTYMGEGTEWILASRRRAARPSSSGFQPFLAFISEASTLASLVADVELFFGVIDVGVVRWWIVASAGFAAGFCSLLPPWTVVAPFGVSSALCAEAPHAAKATASAIRDFFMQVAPKVGGRFGTTDGVVRSPPLISVFLNSF